MNMLERVFYQIPGYKVMMTARIRGDVREDQIMKAVRRTQRIHPLLRSRVVIDEVGNATFSDEDVGMVPVSFIPMRDEMHWYDAYVEAMPDLYEAHTRPLWNLIVIQGKEFSDLVLMASHVITDGMSAVFVLRDLLLSCQDPDAPVQEQYPEEISRALPRSIMRSPKLRLGALAARYFNFRWRRHPIRFNDDDYRAMNDWFWKNNRYQAIFFELDGNDSRGLIEECHRQKVSINNAMIAAFVAARSELVGPFTGTGSHVVIPFDLRRHGTKPMGDTVSMCSGAIEVPLHYQPDQSVWANARKFQASVLKKVSKLDSTFLNLLYFDPNLLDAMSVFALPALTHPQQTGVTDNMRKLIAHKSNVAYKLVSGYVDKVPGTLSSNLGKLNIPQQYGDLTLDRVILLPLLKTNTALYMNGASIGTKMVFALSFGATAMEDADQRLRQMTDIRTRALHLLGIDRPESGERYSR